MKKDLPFLEEFGLTELESKVYITALWLGSFSASVISSRINVPRSTARYTCETLVKKGFFTETKRGNSKIFISENPTKLFSLLHEEERKLTQKKEHLEIMVKELQQHYNPDARLPKVTFYEWEDGVERMFNELLDNPTYLYSFGAGDYLLQHYPNLIKKFREKAKKKYVWAYTFRAKKYESLHANDKPEYKNRYFQFIDELKVDIQIVDDKLTIAALGHSSPIGIVISHKEIVHAFKQIFQEVWLKDEAQEQKIHSNSDISTLP